MCLARTAVRSANKLVILTGRTSAAQYIADFKRADHLRHAGIIKTTRLLAGLSIAPVRHVLVRAWLSALPSSGQAKRSFCRVHRKWDRGMTVMTPIRQSGARNGNHREMTIDLSRDGIGRWVVIFADTAMLRSPSMLQSPLMKRTTNLYIHLH